VGAAVRNGDAILGRAAARSICEGTAAATRLNMMEGMCGVGNGVVLSSGRFSRLSRSCGVVVGAQEVVTM
jgi:hypothetical protein